MLRYVPFIPTLIVFIMNRYRILLNTFSASVEMIMWFLSFLLLAWYITLICICWTNLCDPTMNPPWLSRMTFFLCCWLHWLINKDIDLWFSFFGIVFIWFWYQGDSGFIDYFGTVFPSSVFWRSLGKIVVSSLYVL